MKLWKKIVLFLVALLIIGVAAGYFILRNMITPQRIEEAQGNDDTIVETVKGDIRGSMEDGVYQYLGIPYAQAEERFVPAEEVESWERGFLSL